MQPLLSERASSAGPVFALSPSLSCAVPRISPMGYRWNDRPLQSPRESGRDRMTNFAELLASVTAAAPGRPALKVDERTWTYGALDDAIARVAGVLHRHGVGPGDRVAIQLQT